MQAAAAMSAAEGLDEAAKDAADIAAFFKSGESGKGARLDPGEGGGSESPPGCVIARPGGRRLSGEGGTTDSVGVTRAGLSDLLGRRVVVLHLALFRTCQPATFDDSSALKRGRVITEL